MKHLKKYVLVLTITLAINGCTIAHNTLQNTNQLPTTLPSLPLTNTAVPVVQQPANSNVNQPQAPATQQPINSNVNQPPAPVASLSLPLADALTRVTKKTFGLYVSPGHSPVSPEKFTGYHTGVDFETLPSEQNTDMSISVICSGPLLVKKYATGYGGVVVQRCSINDQAVTVVYGHLRLASISARLNTTLPAGTKLGVLGTGYSTETDGERKHLHLGIHKGSAINILGYVQTKAALVDWIDPLSVLK